MYCDGYTQMAKIKIACGGLQIREFTGDTNTPVDFESKRVVQCLEYTKVCPNKPRVIYRGNASRPVKIDKKLSPTQYVTQSTTVTVPGVVENPLTDNNPKVLLIEEHRRRASCLIS